MRRLLLLLTTLVLALGALTGPAAHAATTGLVVDVASTGTDEPVLVSTDPDVPRGFGVDVFAASAAHHVVVTASGAGLDFDPSSVDLGDLTRNDLDTPAFDVVATRPGLHPITFTVTADDQETVSTSLSYVFAPGDNVHLPAKHSLAFLHGFAWSGSTDQYGHGHRTTRMMTIVDNRWAYLGLPPAGVPVCHHAAHPWTATSGCVRYAFDPATGRAQVGGVVALLDNSRNVKGSFYTDGFVAPSRDAADQPFTFIGFAPSERLRFPRRGTDLTGSWRFDDRYRDHAGVVSARLYFTPHTHYRLSVHDTVSGTTTSSGTYRVTGPGHLVLSHGRADDDHTIAITRDANGRDRLWLTVAGTGPRRPRDAVLMRPQH